jgi:hypothetical protein
MSIYREELAKYKAKRIGQIDQNTPPTKSCKKVDKPWVVHYDFKFGEHGNYKGKKFKRSFAKESDARKLMDKMTRAGYYTGIELIYKGEKE